MACSLSSEDLCQSASRVIADYHRWRAETALATVDTHRAKGGYLCGAEPTVADLLCFGDVTFAELCGFDLNGWTNVAGWNEKVRSLPGFKAPFDLLAMADAEVSWEALA
jgi:glutathione S-transferase